MPSATTLDFTKAAEQNGDCPREHASRDCPRFAVSMRRKKKGQARLRSYLAPLGSTFVKGSKVPFLLSEPRECKLLTCTMLPAFRQPADSIVTLAAERVAQSEDGHVQGQNDEADDDAQGNDRHGRDQMNHRFIARRHFLFVCFAEI